MKSAHKIFYIENLGCAKNQVDAEYMINYLCEAGWELAEDPGEAAVIIVNTCGFINDAKAESIDVSLEFKKVYPDKKVIMAGCLSQRYGEVLKEELHEVDGIVGNRDLRAIGALLDIPRGEGNGEKYYYNRTLLSHPGSAYIKISEGCNHCCSYCSIPLIRGPLKSRGEEEILREIRSLLDQGVFEFNLIAQDLGAFGSDTREGSIQSLFRKIGELKQDFWLRPLYIHPDDFPLELLEIIKEDSRFLPYFDIPFQHASEPVLRAMNRKGSGEKYLDLIRGIREKIPGAVIRSTFLVGFPGEREKDFQTLVDFQEKAELDWMGAFVYSREEGTPSYDMPGRVSRSLARKRKAMLEERQIAITGKQLEAHLGKTLTVLVEEAVENSDFFLSRAYFQAPEVDGLTVIRGSGLTSGETVRVKLFRRNGVDLEGQVCS